MTIIFAVIAAFAIGILIGKYLFREYPVGDLRVDRSDLDDGPHLFLELNTDVRTITAKKRVVFRVKAVDFIPHE